MHIHTHTHTHTLADKSDYKKPGMPQIEYGYRTISEVRLNC